MSLWLLLVDQKAKGIAVPLGFQKSPISQHEGLPPVFKAFVKPDELWDSAGKAVHQCGELLWKEGQLKQSTTVRFQHGEVSPEVLDADEAQGGEMGVHGPSADLMFALAFATRVIAKAYPAIAATGELGTDADTGWVLPVRGVPAKIKAALSVLPLGGLLFFPKANEPEVAEKYYRQADERGVKLVAVKRLDEALEYLGVAINKIYQTPYLGLQSFGYAEHSIFFGRDDETAALLSRLWQRDQARKPGALILAASGAGKSSLAQAGLLWALETARRQDYQADADTAADPIKESLRAKPAFWGETWKPQQDSEYNEAGLVRSITANWAATQRLSKPPMVENLAQLADALPSLTPKQGRFVWLVDQLEELFTLGFPDSAKDAFADFLARLQSQGVWLVAMLRNDFYSTFQEHSPADPKQARLIDVFPSPAHFDLLKPNEAALRHIIEVPAEKADLVFETTTGGYSLADQIAQDLRDGGKDVLPLLQFVLRLVWEDSGKRGSNLLTFEHYQAIGGLHGAIGHSAEAVYQGLDADTQAALPKILWGLALVREKTTVEPGSRYDFTAQPLSIAGYPEGSAGRELIDAFADTKVRLLVCDGDKVRVAHEALFRYWESAQKILEDLRKDMLLRERMRHYLVDYQAAGKPADLLLIAGSRLKHGEELLKNREQLLLGNKDGKNLIDYIKKSSEANRATQRRKAWISAAVIVSLSVLLWQKMQLEKAIESNAEQPFQKALKAEGGNKHMAIAYYDTSMDSYKKLTQQDQDNPIYQERIVDEFNNQLIQKTQVGEFAVDGDLAIYEENLNTQRYLATKYPKQPVYLTNLARLSQDIGTQLVESNRYTGTGNKYFLDAISFFERQASEFPEEQEYQINLENGYKDFANLHLKKGGTGSAAEASQYYQKALAVRQKLASKNPQEHRTALGKIYGALSWAALLDKQYQASLDYANLGMEQDSKLYWIKTNIAHALLFLGHTQEAEDIYLHKPDRGMDESALRQSILDDFKEMRRFGLDHPAMQKIETSFNASLQ